ncbi:MAG: hypothetical protein AAFX54_10570 [Pseudomonadota bacterium]
MMNGRDNRNIRLFVEMACDEPDGVIAAEFFSMFERLLVMRFPRAVLSTRQYDSEAAARADFDADPMALPPLKS